MLGYDNLIADLLLNLTLSVVVNVQYHHVALTSITHAWVYLSVLYLLIKSNDTDRVAHI